MELSVRDVERLENTSFASAFASTAEAAPAEASGVCIASVACEATYACSDGCVNVETLDEVVTGVVTAVAGPTSICTTEALPTTLCTNPGPTHWVTEAVHGVTGITLLAAARGG